MMRRKKNMITAIEPNKIILFSRGNLSGDCNVINYACITFYLRNIFLILLISSPIS